MKNFMKIICKALLSLLSLALAALLVVGGFFGIKGYHMYQDAIKDMPISEKAETIRAVWNDIHTLSFAEGGSTITQQLMKNEYFTQEKKLERKFAEIFAAWDIEKQYSKEDIFELYVNTIYFGSGYYGIYDAAEGYFGKEPSELNEYEAVMLAGLPNAPSAYSPDVSPELAKQQMRQVLDRMVECEVIDQDEADSLLAQAAE